MCVSVCTYARVRQGVDADMSNLSYIREEETWDRGITRKGDLEDF